MDGTVHGVPPTCYNPAQRSQLLRPDEASTFTLLLHRCQMEVQQDLEVAQSLTAGKRWYWDWNLDQSESDIPALPSR